MAKEKKIRAFSEMGIKAKRELKKRLTELGEDAMLYAYQNGYGSKVSPLTGKVVWQDETGALSDSFASAVYEDGIIDWNTVRYVNPNESGNSSTQKSKRGYDGREEVNDYLGRIHPRKGKGDFAVIVVAAMWYAKSLESGEFSNMKYKIKVISGARNYIDRNYNRYISGVYKRYSLGKPNVRVIQGDPLERGMDYDE